MKKKQQVKEEENEEMKKIHEREGEEGIERNTKLTGCNNRVRRG